MKKQYFLIALMPAIVAIASCTTPTTLQSGGSSAVAQESTERAADTINIPALAKVLETYVDDKGLVDYEALQANRQDLDAFNASIQIADPASYERWSESDQIAFLINAYNSLTLKAIIDESPIKNSIKDIPGVWRFDKHGLLQGEQTLNNIEHDILRANFQEPRIHAALVCAALSCPYLRQEPFTGENLDAQLDDQVKIFLSRPEVLTIDQEKNEVQISKIFDWFGQDWVPGFAPAEGFAGTENQKAVLNFISGYLDADAEAYLKAGGYTVSYSNYDWSLNRQP
ncbi:MAG: Protein of unknown function, DUF547 [Phormidesmis priestleyi Ana]|uniref:DUF547 domain-containing protein n=1 Tax=Phormidesmis priestleyi Ana TaxID=1666911 RepID=A0A0P8BY47_9CYAN|nr:MAG: Protein of unknown function, DUF547 [Phormidesmis priestleyi Ana]